MMNIDNIKIIIEELMQNQKGKITLAKRIGKRNEYIFSIGETNYEPFEIIFANDKYIVFTENVAEKIQDKIREKLKNEISN